MFVYISTVYISIDCLGDNYLSKNTTKKCHACIESAIIIVKKSWDYFIFSNVKTSFFNATPPLFIH